MIHHNSLFGRGDFVKVLGCMGESVSLVDAAGTVLATGPRNEALLGWTEADVVGGSSFSRIHPDDLGTAAALFASLAGRPGARGEGEVRHRHKSGHWIWLRARATNLLDNPDVQAIVTTFEDITAQRSAREIHDDLVRSLRNANDGTIRSLAQTVELKDRYTRGHCDRVAEYALRIASRLGLGEEELRDIRHGAWLHDCGKIGVPEAVLNFPGPLDAEMLAVMRQHSGWGADVARRAGLPPRVVNIILYHHERVDGRGYESGLRGEDIPLEARIVSPADIYDAMTTDRSYKRGMTRRDGMVELRRLRGTALDPEVTDVFLDILREMDDGPDPA